MTAATLSRLALTVLAAGVATTAPWAAEVDDLDFSALDANNDGFLAREELPAGHSLQRLFGAFDRDGDQRLNGIEFDAFTGSSESETDDD